MSTQHKQVLGILKECNMRPKQGIGSHISPFIHQFPWFAYATILQPRDSCQSPSYFRSLLQPNYHSGTIKHVEKWYPFCLNLKALSFFSLRALLKITHAATRPPKSLTKEHELNIDDDNNSNEVLN